MTISHILGDAVILPSGAGDRRKSHALAQFEHEDARGVMLVGDHSVKNSLFYGRFDLADGLRRRQPERIHYFLAVNGRLEVAQMVALVDILHLADDCVEVAQMSAHFFRIA